MGRRRWASCSPAICELVQRTSRFVSEPADLEPVFRRQTPAIGAMWHGQHLMLSFSWPHAIARVAALISRSGDGGMQAAALRRLGVIPVRGSGGRAGRAQRKGGAPALRGLMRALEDGASVAMTADVAKVARVAGLGIVTLARLSGRPILPMAVVAKRRIDFKSWDRASIGLPFNRCAIVIGDPIRVPADADDDGDGGGAARGRGWARRGPRPRLRHGRLARSRRGFEASMSLPLSLTAYRLVTGLVSPLSGALLSLRLNKAKEDPMRIDERRGLASLAAARRAAGLAARRQRRRGAVADAAGRAADAGGGRHALVTTGTVTSARLLAQRLPPGALHQFAPLDTPAFMRRFFAHWRPDLGADRRIRDLAEHDRRSAPRRRAAGDGQRADERALLRALAARARLHRARCSARVDLCLAQSDGRRAAARRARRGEGRRRRQSEIRRARRRRPTRRSSPNSPAASRGGRSGSPPRPTPARSAIAAEAHRRVAAGLSRRADADRAAPSRARRGDRRRTQAARLHLRPALARRAAGARRRRSISATRSANSACSTASPASCWSASRSSAKAARIRSSRRSSAAPSCTGRASPISSTSTRCSTKRAARRPSRDADELAATLLALFADPGRLRAMARAAAKAVEAQGGAAERVMRAIAPLLPADEPPAAA